MGFRGFGFRVVGLEFGVWGLGVRGLGFSAWGVAFGFGFGDFRVGS